MASATASSRKRSGATGVLPVLPLHAGLRAGPAAGRYRMVLSPTSDFFRYFNDPQGKK